MKLIINMILSMFFVSSVYADGHSVEELKTRLDALESALEDGAAGGGMVDGWWNRTSIGGYGELHIEGGDYSGDSADVHRYVLFFNHDFDDNIRMFSEFELEHALSGEGQVGEVELEQMYIEIDLASNKQIKSGVFLMPVGILNETHEPNTFYGVDRNLVEKRIIPTTWWEAGVMLSQQYDNGISMDYAVHTGLSDTSYTIRDGRQKVAKAVAEKYAATARMKYTGIAGTEIAAVIHKQDDITQQQVDEEVPADLYEVHYITSKQLPNGSTLEARALMAEWSLSSDGAKTAGQDKQKGYYIEPAIRLPGGKLGIFARYAMYDLIAGDSDDSEVTSKTWGFNYWPHPNVVFKFDYQDVEYEASPSKNDDKIQLGVGFMY